MFFDIRDDIYYYFCIYNITEYENNKQKQNVQGGLYEGVSARKNFAHHYSLDYIPFIPYYPFL